MIYLFYEEPDRDRWLAYDRYPRAFIRRVIRGKPKPGGVMRWFLNLRSGLEELGIPFKVNDYRAVRKNPERWAHVIGKPHVIKNLPPTTPIIFGPGVASHPIDTPFWNKPNLKHLLIPCRWFKEMYDRDLPRPIPTSVWAAGIDTRHWCPSPQQEASKQVLVYDKIRWEREQYVPQLLDPIVSKLKNEGWDPVVIRYGFYEEETFREQLRHSKFMVFLCEHETQGFAYQQALSAGVPLLAWDRKGYWKDPTLYPDRVKFEPVTSVPYFDDRCGLRFSGYAEFPETYDQFMEKLTTGMLNPRNYITENLTLAGCARKYLEITAGIREGS